MLLFVRPQVTTLHCDGEYDVGSRGVVVHPSSSKHP